MEIKIETKTITLENIQPYILCVTLQRPESRNAINSIMMQELRDLWHSLYVDQKNYRCIILTGAPPAFCAGADLKERNHIDLATWRKQHTLLEQAMLAMLDCPLAIIAAVNGAAYGGGLELVLASDFAYAATTAMFSQSEVKVGLMPGALGTQHLPRACGLQRAKELAFTGDAFTATDALQWGIINKMCEPDQLLQEAIKTAQKIVTNAPLAVKQVKKAMNMSQQLDIKSGFIYELEAYNQLLSSHDREEGIQAFNEKRKPQFIGE